MLITCKECQKEVSDKAIACPHCGYPMTSRPPRPSRAKHKRLPNGFGSITELKNRSLRKPFFARICVGKTDEGKPILRSLKPTAYFKTYNDAYQALMEYNKNPFDLSDDITLKEVYDRFYKDIKGVLNRSLFYSWEYCRPLYDMNIKKIRIIDIKNCINDASVIINRGEHKGETRKATPVIKHRMKTILGKVFDYAVENDLVQNNVARLCKLGDDAKIIEPIDAHIAFTKDEMNILWSHSQNEFVQIILIQCYTGFRPNELCTLKCSNVNINDWTIIGGMKTDNGKDRLVPIHPKIREFIQTKYNSSIELKRDGLFYIPKPMDYQKYHYHFNHCIQKYNLNENHTPHDCRKTFVTMAKEFKMDEYVLKRIIGHSIQDLTERVYTERPLDTFQEEIAKIP